MLTSLHFLFHLISSPSNRSAAHLSRHLRRPRALCLAGASAGPALCISDEPCPRALGIASERAAAARPFSPSPDYTSESAGENVACLYSLAEKRAYRLTLPDPPIIEGIYLIGSSHFWVITVDERSEMHLVIPITREQIALPSVITLSKWHPSMTVLL